MTLKLHKTGIEFPDGSWQKTAGVNGNRNLIINGDMRIAQRGTSSGTANTFFPVDRWRIASKNNSSKYSAQQSSDVPSGQGFTNSIVLTSLSAYTELADDYFLLQHRFEGNNIAHLDYGTANAKTVTVSFWVKSSLTGTFAGALRDGSAYSSSYIFEYTILSANTWEYKTVTISGPTSGTWLTGNSVGAELSFAVGGGTDFNGTVNTWQSTNAFITSLANRLVNTNGATLYITGVQLEVGEATPYCFTAYDLELQRCQRYYQKSYPYGTAVGSVTNVGRLNVGGGNGTGSTTGFLGGPFVKYKVPMRATATVTVYDDQGNSNKCIRFVLGASNNSNQTIIVADSYNEGFWTYSSGTTNDSGVGIHYQAEAEL